MPLKPLTIEPKSTTTIFKSPIARLIAYENTQLANHGWNRLSRDSHGNELGV